MPFKLERRKWIWVFSLMLLLNFFGVTANASGIPDVVVKVGDTTATSGEMNCVISIYMTNWTDTIAGFDLWLILDRPDIFEFQTAWDTLYDTSFWRCTSWVGQDTCDAAGWVDITDSVLMDTLSTVVPDSIDVITTEAWFGNLDVSGTLCENWESIQSYSIGNIGNNIRIQARANTTVPPYTPGIGYPQLGEIPVIKLLADVFDIPSDWEDRTAEIYIQPDNLDNFLIDENGDAIGVVTDTIIESACFWCEQWADPESTTCWSYMEVPCDTEGVSIDSVWCCDTVIHEYFDTSKVQILHGELRILDGICGDINCDGIINIFDITYLIAYLYLGGPPPCDLPMADVNGDGVINIFDVIKLIKYIYEGGELNCR